MSFSKWVEDYDWKTNLDEECAAKNAWNAAIDEAVKVISIKDYTGLEQYSYFIEKLEKLKE